MEWYSLCFIDEQKGWICGGWSTGTGQIIHTSDGGNTWVIQQNDQGTWFKSIFFVDEDNGWAGRRYGEIYRTTDGGLNWNMINTGAEGIIESIYFVNSLKGWAVSSSSEILISEDGGNTWTLQYDDYGQLNSVFFIDEEIGWAVGDIKNLHTIDGGNNWEVQYYGGQLNDVVFSNQYDGYAVGDYALLRTIDGGETWMEEEYYTPHELFAISAVGSRCWISGSWGLILNKGTSETTVFVPERTKLMDSSLSIFPNPVGDYFHYDSDKNFKTIKIYDITGQIVKTESDFGKDVNVSKLDKGIYLVELITFDSESIFAKIIKQ
jgi:YD repeat-containing protein